MNEKSFLIAMIKHHEEALAMAKKIAPSSRLAVFAHNIISTQSEEINKMETWLKDWFDYQNDSEGKKMKM